MKITYSLICVCVLMYVNSFAQVEVLFRDSLDLELIPNVNVILHNTKTNEFDYFTSNGGGSIFIDPKKLVDSFSLNITHISYVSKKLQDVVNFDKKIIYLTPKTNMLTEIVFKATDPSLETVNIVFDTSRTHVTTKVADLLKNDPRFKIENNKVTYRGKPVENLLIDDMDLSGDNYMHLFRLADLRTFESIDVIQNYYKNPLDKSFEKPEVALRLNSIDKSRSSTIGGADLNISHLNLNELKGEMYHLRPDLKVYLAGGTSSLQERMYTKSLKDYNIGLSLFNTYIPDSRIDNSYWDKNNRSYGGLIQLAYLNSNNIKNRTEVFYNENKRQQNVSQESTVSMPLYNYVHNSVNLFNRKVYNVGLESEHIYTNKSVNNNTTIYSTLSRYNYGSITFNSGDITDTIQNKVSGDFILESSILNELTTKVNKSLFIKNRTIFKFDKSIESYLNNNKRNQELYNVQGEFDNGIVGGSVGLENKLHFKHKGLYHNFSYAVNFKYLNDNKVFDIQIDNSLFRRSASQYEKFLILGVFRIDNFKRRKKIEYSIKPSIGLARSYLGDVGGKSVLIFNNQFEISSKWGSTATKFHVNHKKDFLSYDKVLPKGFNDGSYILFKGFSSIPINESVDVFSITARRGLLKQWLYTLLLRFKYSPKDIAIRYEQNPIIGNYSYQIAKSNQFLSQFDSEYKLLMLPVSIINRLSYTNIKSAYLYNGINSDQTIESVTYDVGLKYTRGLLGINYTFQQSFSFYRIESESFSKNVINNHKFSFKYTSRNDKLVSELGIFTLIYDQLHEPIIDLQFSIDYIINNKLEIGVYGENLINHKNIIEEYYNITTNARSIYDVRGSQIGAIARYDF